MQNNLIASLEIQEIENIAQLVRWRVAKTPSDVAFQTREGASWRNYSWKETDEEVEKIAAGLISLGFIEGSKASIMGNTQLAWCLTDLAIIRSAGISIGVYPTLTGDQAAYIIHKSESSFLFLEDEIQLEKMIPLFSDLPILKKVIIWKNKGELSIDAMSLPSDFVITMTSLKKIGEELLSKKPKACKMQEQKIKPDDLVNLVFTSGTTGPPKGACLSHQNIMYELRSLDSSVKLIQPGDRMVIFLPLAHVGEKVGGLYNRIYQNVSGAFIEDITQVVESLKEIQPTSFGSVPRIFEKVHTKILSQISSLPSRKQKLFHWAIGIGKRYFEAKFNHQAIPFALNLQFQMADGLVLKKLRAIFGGKVKHCISGAAPISTEILEFFLATGLLIMEGYGQTETSCFITMNTKESYRFGSVGKAMDYVRLRIADDGEIQVHGPLVFQGYFKEEKLTKETISLDGWLSTGDIGRIDEDGFLFITGRKKDIIITSGGKNITPSNIETMLTNHPLIEQAIVHGDRRKYLTALVAVDTAIIKQWAEEKEIDTKNLSVQEIIDLADLKAEIQSHLDFVNTRLAKYETIKDFRILPRLLDIENGEITPTLKVKRNIVQTNYAHLLDAMYVEE